MKGACPVIHKNVGTVDRIIRMSIGTILLLAGYTVMAGAAQVVANITGAIAIGTGIIGFCPLYVPFKISTVTNGKT